MPSPIPFDAGVFFGGMAIGAIIGAFAMLFILWPAVLARDYANDVDPTEDGTRPL
jgi:hypothetical protein